MMAHLVDFPDLQQKLYGLCPLPQNQPEAPSTGAWLVSFLMGFDADVTPSRGCLALGRRAIRARPQFGPRAPSPGGRHIRSKARVVRRGVPVGGTPSLANRSLRRASGVTRATELAETQAPRLKAARRRPPVMPVAYRLNTAGQQQRVAVPLGVAGCLLARPMARSRRHGRLVCPRARS